MTGMSQYFMRAAYFTNCWNTTDVTNMNYGCNAFNHSIDFNTVNMTSMSYTVCMSYRAEVTNMSGRHVSGVY